MKRLRLDNGLTLPTDGRQPAVDLCVRWGDPWARRTTVAAGYDEGSPVNAAAQWMTRSECDMTAEAAAKFACWKMGCACADAAWRFGKAWLRDPAVPLELRYSVALALLIGEAFH